MSTHFYPCGNPHRDSRSLRTMTGCASLSSEITKALLQVPAKNSSSVTLDQVPPYPHGRLDAILWHLLYDLSVTLRMCAEGQCKGRG